MSMSTMKRLRGLTVLLVLMFVNMATTEIIKDTRPGIDRQKPDDGPQTRIIGGNNAQQGRYPYIVSLMNSEGVGTCGGTLVAPDVVLTAAHCNGVLTKAEVGSWNRADPNDDKEEFRIESPEHIHPMFHDDHFAYDFMLLKLAEPSTKQYVKLNDDPDLPTGERVDEVTALGFGFTRIADPSSMASILQEVDLTYMPNDVCAESKSPGLTEGYQGLITPDMLCAQDNGQDACQGDSGGPLVITNSNGGSDVMVGIISWGYGCALPSFPGVYSRISDQVDWLKSTICEISNQPPETFNCGPRTVPVTVAIQFDDFPTETGWSITDKVTGKVLAEVPPGSYDEVRSQVEDTVFLPAGATCTFTIKDSFGDGLCCDVPGNFLVVAGTDLSGEVLVMGGGGFGLEEDHEFSVSTSYEKPQETEVPTVGEGEILLTIEMLLDDHPQEIGWRIDRLDIEVEPLIRVPAGIYTVPQTTVVRTLVLEKNELYYFKAYDVVNNGIDGGHVKLFLGTTDTNDTSRLIFQADGDFESDVDFSFLASLNTEKTDPPIIYGNSFITLELRMDLYPEEIGLQLRVSDKESATERQDNSDDTVLFFRPPRYYAGRANEVVIEQIPIPYPNAGSSRQYTFVITDSHGDGMCCGWSGELDTGYSIYRGLKRPGNLLFSSKFEGEKREVSSFILDDGTDASAADGDQAPFELLPSVYVRVFITLDQFPDETGFYIENAVGERVVDVPPGTYNEQFELVQEVYNLEIGVYSFTIVDTTGDGLLREDSYYALNIDGDSSRPALLTGGVFAKEETQQFILEGTVATDSLSVMFTLDDKPEEFGFFVNRLDLVDSEALVAKVPHGSYKIKGQVVSETIPVKEGGLYRVVLEDFGQNGIGGDIRIVLGSSDSNKDLKPKTYTVKDGDWQEWQVKVIAGGLSASSEDAASLDLRITFDEFPHEVEWILLGNVNEKKFDITRSLPEQEVIAYGPPEGYSASLKGSEYVETIKLPPHVGEKTFTMIVTDHAGDGVCCTFGNGGPVELFEGSVDAGNLLFSHPFKETGRVVSSFVLLGNASTQSTAFSLSYFWLPFSSLLLVISFVF